jgi:hypothetical protein
MLPREEGQDGARLAVLVAIIEMIGGGIVEIDGLLHQAKAKRPRVELHISRRFPGDRCDVMDARHGVVLLPYRTAVLVPYA